MAKMKSIRSPTLAQSSLCPGTKIVILTQHDEPQLAALSLEAGASAFLSKTDLSHINEILESLQEPLYGIVSAVNQKASAVP